MEDSCNALSFAKNLKRRTVAIVISAFVVLAAFLAVAGLEKSVTIDDNGKIIKITTYKADVKGLLTSANYEIGEKDKIYPELDARVKKNMVIKIKRAVPVKIVIGEDEIVVNTAEETVKDVLKVEGIVLNEYDKISEDLDTKVTSDMNIKIVRVVEEILTESKTVAYRVVKKLDNNMEKGETKVLQNGEDGEVEIQTKVVYEDGKEVIRKKIGEVIKKAPVDKIVSVGTLSWFIPSRGDSSKVYYTSRIKMKATKYTANYQCTGKNPGDRGFGITSSGMRVKRDPKGYSTVAVDTRVIPLGTKLYVEGYGYAIAADTGGGVKSNLIDLYFDEHSEEYRRWFTHYVNVYILK